MTIRRMVEESKNLLLPTGRQCAKLVGVACLWQNGYLRDVVNQKLFRMQLSSMRTTTSTQSTVLITSSDVSNRRRDEAFLDWMTRGVDLN